MTFPAWVLNFFAIAAVSGALGVGIATSAPSSLQENQPVQDEKFQFGQDGIDHMLISGPRSAANNKIPACADPARRGNLRPCVLPG